jgi:hypothetical protein
MTQAYQSAHVFRGVHDGPYGFVFVLSHNIHLTVKLPPDHARNPQASPGEI